MNSVFVNPGIVASLVIVVIVSGNFFFFFYYINVIQYVAAPQNINTILYGCILSDLRINMLTTYMIVNINFLMVLCSVFILNTQ